jgi:hypothetical protein
MKSLTVTEYQNQRILSTAQLAECYETTSGVISNNFNNNKDRYQEGKHFYCLEGETLKQFKSESLNLGVAPNLNKLYLWTEKGCLHHAKSLGTDKAWEVFEMLEETYFNKQQALKPMTQAEIIAASAQQLVEIERKVLTLDSKITNALDIFTTPAKDDWRQEMNDKVNQMCLEQDLSYQGFRHELYTELENTARVDLSVRQLRLRKRMKKEGATITECKTISKLDIVERDPKLRPIFEGIVRKYQAKYAVE